MRWTVTSGIPGSGVVEMGVPYLDFVREQAEHDDIWCFPVSEALVDHVLHAILATSVAILENRQQGSSIDGTLKLLCNCAGAIC